MIRLLQPEDVPQAMRLSIQAGWNQTPADWQRMLSLEPAGCFAVERDQTLIGTTVCVTFGPVAWLAMVLVDEAWRGQGIGSQLVQTGLNFANSQGVKTIRLDATPLGRPVYERLGFRPQFQLTRWGGIPESFVSQEFGNIIEELAPDPKSEQQLCDLDRRATHIDRSAFLRRLWEEARPWVARDSSGQMSAFLSRRTGRVALQLGPGCGNGQALQLLLESALALDTRQMIYIDLPDDRPELVEWLLSAGLTSQRTLLRMCRGEFFLESPELYHISSGPELG